jgi:hypothetical protein
MPAGKEASVVMDTGPGTVPCLNSCELGFDLGFWLFIQDFEWHYAPSNLQCHKFELKVKQITSSHKASPKGEGWVRGNQADITFPD